MLNVSSLSHTHTQTQTPLSKTSLKNFAIYFLLWFFIFLFFIQTKAKRFYQSQHIFIFILGVWTCSDDFFFYYSRTHTPHSIWMWATLGSYTALVVFQTKWMWAWSGPPVQWQRGAKDSNSYMGHFRQRFCTCKDSRNVSPMWPMWKMMNLAQMKEDKYGPQLAK